MGFELPNITYVIKFEDDPIYDGLEIKVKEMSVGDLTTMLGLFRLKNLETASMTADDMEAIKTLFAKVSSAVVGWNVEEDGQPVPVTVETVEQLGMKLWFKMFIKILTEVMDVDMDLKDESADGGRSALEQSLAQASE